MDQVSPSIAKVDALRYFEPRFIMTNDLYNYVEFFEKILYRASRDLVDQRVTIVEYKHIFGMLFKFDENGERVTASLEEEIIIISNVERTIRERFPMFRIRIIASGLKVLGKEHIQ